MLVLEKANHAQLRLRQHDFLPSKDDIHVAPWQVQKFQLREGCLVQGRYRRGQGATAGARRRAPWMVAIRASARRPDLQGLTTIDPDFHYAWATEAARSRSRWSTSCPDRARPARPDRRAAALGQDDPPAADREGGREGLPGRAPDGAARRRAPEEATEWKRTLERGEVFVSTNDERRRSTSSWPRSCGARARRLVELGKDVVLLLDSITRLGRAATTCGHSGKTMSGGIDTRALERPKALFGSARNTEQAGSLTILGTTLVDTGSRMDQ
jgi:transcription termination factor Rho